MSFVWNAPVASRMDLPKGRVTISQGQFAVSDDPDTVMTTVLGSCVAACIRDPVLGLGGMNHFVLPGPVTKVMSKSEAARYGCQLMELLVDGLLARGANVWRLEAKILVAPVPETPSIMWGRAISISRGSFWQRTVLRSLRRMSAALMAASSNIGPIRARPIACRLADVWV